MRLQFPLAFLFAALLGATAPAPAQAGTGAAVEPEADEEAPELA